MIIPYFTSIRSEALSTNRIVEGDNDTSSDGEEDNKAPTSRKSSKKVSHQQYHDSTVDGAASPLENIGGSINESQA